MSLILRGCPRCGGDLSPEEEMNGPEGKEIEYACIQCSQRVYLKAEAVNVKRTSYNDPRDGRQSGHRM